MMERSKILIAFVMGILVNVNTAFCADIIVNSSTKINLPLANTAGRLYRVNDSVRGLWMDSGSMNYYDGMGDREQFFSLSGEVVNVKEFGAKGDGVTDDTAAIQAAHDAANGTYKANLIFPPGIYKITSLTLSGGTVRWFGAGQSDDTMGNATIIRGSGVGAHLIRTNGLRYVTIYGMTLDANGVKDSALIIDGPGVNGFNLTNVIMTGALVNTFHIAPTNNTQVSESQCQNCMFISPSASNAQVRVSSINALGLQFFGGGTGGSAPYGFHVDKGGIIVYDFVLTGNTTADFYLPESGFAKISGGHSESPSTAQVIMAPAFNPPASHDSMSTIIQGFNDAILRTTSVSYASGRPFTLIGNYFSGDVSITSPGIAYALGNTFGSGKKFTGTGRVVFGRMSDATQLSFGVGLGAELPGYVNEATAATTNNLVIPFWFKNDAPTPEIMRYAAIAARSTSVTSFANLEEGAITLLAKRTSDDPDLREILIAKGSGQVEIPVATGTAPLVVSSTTPVPNLTVKRGDTFVIGDGTAITKHLSATMTWDPVSINNGAATSTTVIVTGATVGDTVAVGFSTAVPGRALLVGAVTAVDTVTVTLANHTGGALNLASGTVRADVWKH